MATEAQKKQQKQLILLGIIILITGAIFLFSRKNKDTAPDNLDSFNGNLEASSSPININQMQETDLTILSSRVFEKLDKNGKYPVDPGKTGRKNPFIPYEEGSLNE